MIAHLTVDKNGKRGDEPGFDKNQGQGLRPRPRRRFGQRQSARPSGACTPGPLTGNSPTRTRGAPTTTTTTPTFQETIGWFASLIEKGYMPSVAAVTGQSRDGPLRRRQVRHDHQRLLEDRQHHRRQGHRDRRRADPGRAERQARQHVQRPGRLHLGRLEEQAGRRQVGRVPRLPRLPGHRRREGRRLPCDPVRRPTRPRPHSRPRAST